MFHAVRMLPDPIFEMYGGGTVKVTGKRRNAEGLRYIYCPHPGLDQLELKLVWAFESQVKVLGAPKTVAVIFPTFLYHEPIYMLCYLHSDSVEVMIEKAYNSEYESLQQDLANRPQMLRQKDAYEERMKLVDKVFGKFTEKVTPPAPSQSQAHSLSA